MISRGKFNLSSKEVFKDIDEFDLARYYLGISSVPICIQSPLRQDLKPSLNVFTDDGKRLKFYDFATNRYGFVRDLICQMYNLDFRGLLEKVYRDREEIKKVSHIKINGVRTHIGTIHRDTETLEVHSIRRAWKQSDFDYWQSYGVSKPYLLHSDTYPISHIILSGKGYSKLIKADPLAYTFIERKDGIITEKIYQPFNKKGLKWRSSRDKSILDMWTKLPKSGDIVIITSSRKDALCIWSNTGIPAISPQSESTEIKKVAIDELKRRFRKVFVLYDNDFQNKINNGRIDGQTIAGKYGLIQIEIPFKYKSKDISDLYRNFGHDIVLNVIKFLINK